MQGRQPAAALDLAAGLLLLPWEYVRTADVVVDVIWHFIFYRLSVCNMERHAERQTQPQCQCMVLQHSTSSTGS